MHSAILTERLYGSIQNIADSWGMRTTSRKTDTINVTFPSGKYTLVMTKNSPNGSYTPSCNIGTLISSVTKDYTGISVYSLDLSQPTQATLTYPQGYDYSFSDYVLLG